MSSKIEKMERRMTKSNVFSANEKSPKPDEKKNKGKRGSMILKNG